MDRCPSGHERTMKPDGSLGLFCTDCGYRFPSTTEFESLSVNSESCEIERLIQDGMRGMSLYGSPTSSFYLSGYSSSNESEPSISELVREPYGGDISYSSEDFLPELIRNGTDGVEVPNLSPLLPEARSAYTSFADEGARPKRRANLGAQAMAEPGEDYPKLLQPSLLVENEMNSNNSFADSSQASSKNDSVRADIESGQEKLENGCQIKSFNTNIAVKTISPLSQQRVSLSRASSASPVLSLGNRNNINNSSFESFGISSIGDENTINNSALDSSGDICIGRGNIIQDSRVESETSIVIGDDNKMRDSKFTRKQNSTNKEP